MGAKLLGVALQMLPPGVLVLRLDRVHIGGEGGLGIDDHVAPARQADDHVRAQQPGLPDSDRSVWKSQYSVMPESSSTFLSVSSPHRPRVLGAARSALTSLAASPRTRSWPSTTFFNSLVRLP